MDELKENTVLEVPLMFYYVYQADFRLEDETIVPLQIEKGLNGLTSIRFGN